MFKEIVDLSHPLEIGMPVFGARWHTPFLMEPVGAIDEVGRETKKITMGTHTGTHIDAPRHFIKGGETIDKLDLQTLCGPVSILDFSYLGANEGITVYMLKGCSFGVRVLFRFNWARHWGAGFYNDYPFFSAEAAQHLVDSGVRLVGMDTPSPDDSRTKLLSDEDSKIHKLFLKNRIVLVEYLNLDALADYEGWNIFALPLKIKGADGAPARICLVR